MKRGLFSPGTSQKIPVQFASALLKCGFLSIPLSGSLSILLLLHKAEEIGSFWLAQLPCSIAIYAVKTQGAACFLGVLFQEA
jgi:hypothetical protein